MPDDIQWETSAPRDGEGRSFLIQREHGTVPGVLWLPPGGRSLPPVVLLGHGGSSHKRSARVIELAQWFTSVAGIAAVAIDGPYHGERLPTPLTNDEYQDRIAAEGAVIALDRMVEDWLAAVDALGAAGEVDADRIGYVGVSMATRYGLPTAVAAGDRMRCVVFGKFGFTTTDKLPASMDTSDRIRADAPRLAAPVLFHLQWDDDHFERNGQLELFDLIGSQDKRLIAYPGQHTRTSPEAIGIWQRFVAGHLVPDFAG